MDCGSLSSARRVGRIFSFRCSTEINKLFIFLSIALLSVWFWFSNLVLHIQSLPPPPPPSGASRPKRFRFETVSLLFVYSYTPKLHKEDEVRVRLAVSHYEPYIDFDTLLRPTEESGWARVNSVWSLHTYETISPQRQVQFVLHRPLFTLARKKMISYN